MNVYIYACIYYIRICICIYIYIYLFISIYKFNKYVYIYIHKYTGGFENGTSSDPSSSGKEKQVAVFQLLRPIYSYKTWSFQSYVTLPEGNVGLKVVQTRFVLALVVSTHLNLNQFNIPNHQIWLNIKNNTLTTTNQNATCKLRL